MPPTPTKTTTTKPATQAKAKPAKKPDKPKEEPKQTSVVSDRNIVYPDVTARICMGENAITVGMAKDLMYWETEKEYQQRRMNENAGTKEEHWVYGETYLMKNGASEKVRAWNNLDNRPFDENWARGFAQTILLGQWAGSITIPGETVNGSTIVVSRTERVESGQHSLAALIIAHEMWTKNPDAYPFWADKKDADGKLTGPVIETIVITGISEDPRVLMTVDNCKQRSEADVFYTSELFRSLSPTDRRECSRMMAAAVDLLWKRTDAKGYKTLPEVVGFQERHKRILKAVEHLFKENALVGTIKKKISALKLSAGQSSALLYLMGCSGPGTDGDEYRNLFPPTEKGLDWTRWDKAKDFWALIGSHETFRPVRVALAKLIETTNEEGDVTGLGGRLLEKLAVIQKAWDVWVSHDPSTGEPPFAENDERLMLSYNNLDDDGNPLPDGEVKLLDSADFLGIDCPEQTKEKVPEAPAVVFTPEEIEKAKLQALEDRATAAKKEADEVQKGRPAPKKALK